MTAPARPQLTDRELEVLVRSAAGETYDRIAADFGIHPRAVGKIASRMFPKLDATSMPQAVLLACRAGLLDGRPFLRHGDHAGYEAHRKRRIPYCEACREGEKAYRQRYRKPQRGQEGPSVPAEAANSRQG